MSETTTHKAASAKNKGVKLDPCPCTDCHNSEAPSKKYHGESCCFLSREKLSERLVGSGLNRIRFCSPLCMAVADEKFGCSLPVWYILNTCFKTDEKDFSLDSATLGINMLKRAASRNSHQTEDGMKIPNSIVSYNTHSLEYVAIIAIYAGFEYDEDDTVLLTLVERVLDAAEPAEWLEVLLEKDDDFRREITALFLAKKLVIIC